MLYLFEHEGKLRVSSENPDTDFTTSLDNSFIAYVPMLRAVEATGNVVRNILANGSADTTLR